MVSKQNKDQNNLHTEPRSAPLSPTPKGQLDDTSDDLADLKTDDKTSANPTKRVSPSKKTDDDPPRTTTGGWFTAPKFGSAGSGGAEIEPGPKRN